MNKKLLLLMLCFLFLIPLSFGADTTIFEESFIFLDNYVDNGWTYSDGSCASASQYPHPVYAPLWNSNAFGSNDSNGCGFAYSQSIKQDLPQEITTGTATITYRYALLNDSIVSTDPASFILRNRSNLVSEYVAIRHKFSSIKVESDLTGFEICTYGNLTMPYNFSEIRLQIDLSNSVYSLVVDNLIVCQDSNLTTTPELYKIGGIVLSNAYSIGDRVISYTDNIRITGDDTTAFTQFGVAQPCNSKEECISDKCLNGFCALKLAKESCSANGECLSGECVNSICTKPSMWNLIDASKTESFGDDTDTNNFLALLFIILIPAGVVYYGRGHKGAIYVGVGVFFALSLFFALVGWLSAFILVGNIMTGLIVVVFAFMLGGGSH